MADNFLQSFFTGQQQALDTYKFMQGLMMDRERFNQQKIYQKELINNQKALRSQAEKNYQMQLDEAEQRRANDLREDLGNYRSIVISRDGKPVEMSPTTKKAIETSGFDLNAQPEETRVIGNSKYIVKSLSPEVGAAALEIMKREAANRTIQDVGRGLNLSSEEQSIFESIAKMNPSYAAQYAISLKKEDKQGLKDVLGAVGVQIVQQGGTGALEKWFTKNPGVANMLGVSRAPSGGAGKKEDDPYYGTGADLANDYLAVPENRIDPGSAASFINGELASMPNLTPSQTAKIRQGFLDTAQGFALLAGRGQSLEDVLGTEVTQQTAKALRQQKENTSAPDSQTTDEDAPVNMDREILNQTRGVINKAVKEVQKAEDTFVGPQEETTLQKLFRGSGFIKSNLPGFYQKYIGPLGRTVGPANR